MYIHLHIQTSIFTHRLIIGTKPLILQFKLLLELEGSCCSRRSASKFTLTNTGRYPPVPIVRVRRGRAGVRIAQPRQRARRSGCGQRAAVVQRRNDPGREELADSAGGGEGGGEGDHGRASRQGGGRDHRYWRRDYGSYILTVIIIDIIITATAVIFVNDNDHKDNNNNNNINKSNNINNNNIDNHNSDNTSSNKGNNNGNDSHNYDNNNNNSNIKKNNYLYYYYFY